MRKMISLLHRDAFSLGTHKSTSQTKYNFHFMYPRSYHSFAGAAFIHHIGKCKCVSISYSFPKLFYNIRYISYATYARKSIYILGM